MLTVKEQITQMLEDGVTVQDINENLIEEIKQQICDHYCKYPGEYKAKDSILDMQDMINEVCDSCPLNAL